MHYIPQNRSSLRKKVFCINVRFADDLTNDIACSLVLPSSIVSVEGLDECKSMGVIRSAVVVIREQKKRIPGTLSPDAAAVELVEAWRKQVGPLGPHALWKAYVSKLLSPSVEPEVCLCPLVNKVARRILFSSIPALPEWCLPCP